MWFMYDVAGLHNSLASSFQLLLCQEKAADLCPMYTGLCTKVLSISQSTLITAPMGSWRTFSMQSQRDFGVEQLGLILKANVIHVGQHPPTSQSKHKPNKQQLSSCTSKAQKTYTHRQYMYFTYGFRTLAPLICSCCHSWQGQVAGVCLMDKWQAHQPAVQWHMPPYS